MMGERRMGQVLDLLKRLRWKLWVLLLACAWSAALSAEGVSVDLSGSWRSAVGDDRDWATSHFDDTRWTSSSLPATWAELGYGRETGTIWFRHRAPWPPIGTKEPSERLGLWIGEAAYGHYEVYVGGTKIGSHGSEDRPLPAPKSRVFELPPSAVGDGGELVVALRYQRSPWTPWRYADSRGPVGDSVRIGDLETLSAQVTLERLRRLDATWPMAVLAVLLAAVALYHLLLFSRRRESPESLWFAMTVLCFLLTIFSDQWIGEWSSDHGLARRSLDFATHLVIPLVIQFSWSFLARPIGRLLRAYQISHVLLALFVVAVPDIGWVFATQTWRWWWGLPCWILLAVTLASELRRGDLEARVIGAGGLLISCVGLFEWAFQIAGRGSTLPLPLWGAAAFAVAMTVALAVRFHRVHGELDAFRQQLEEMVTDRRHELQVANQRLQSEITEKSLAQDAMHMLERGVEQSIDGILVADNDHRIQFVNQAWARMHGYQVFELLGRDLRIFHSAEQRERDLAPCLEQVRSRGAFEGEIGHIRKDGSSFPTWMSFTRLQDPIEGTVGLVAVGRDITERKKAEVEQASIEAKLRRARKLESLGGLAEGIANDYNNALTGVLSNAALLARGLKPGTMAAEKVRHVEDAAERARDLTVQLLAYAGENALELRRVSAGEFLSGLETELKHRVGDRAHLHLELAEGLPQVEADPEQLTRALHHLVDNALEALDGEPGQLTIHTRLVDVDSDYLRNAELDESQRPGPHVAIEVTDTGGGIADDVRSRIFDPFFSTRPTARGLGLAELLGIVRAHRGAIKVRSGQGEGTTFELLFPAVASPAQDLEVPVARSDADFEGSGTVLVVDDESLLREVSESILSESGFQVLTATDGPEALELLRRDHHLIRLVLLDNRMPQMDGREVLSAIRRLDPDLRVILMSGFPEKEVLRGFRERDVSGFLQKPFRPDDLLGKVRQVLEDG